MKLKQLSYITIACSLLSCSGSFVCIVTTTGGFLTLSIKVANVQANSMTGIVSMVGILMIYSRICTTTVTRVFSLQVTMPDYIISWLGGREAANILGDLAGEAKNIFASASSETKKLPGVKLPASHGGKFKPTPNKHGGIK